MFRVHHLPGRTPIQRGRRAEKSFFHAWRNHRHYPSWMVAVEPPTEYEDLIQKTDAVIVRITGQILKIQIKSHPIEEEKRRELMHYGVIPLSIFPCDTTRSIRRRTRKEIRAFFEFQKQLPPPPPTKFSLRKRRRKNHYQRKHTRFR